MRVINLTKNSILAENLSIANTPLKRIIGLLNRKEFKRGEALLIQPCQQVHTFFMRFPIDLLFLNRENRVIKLIKNLKPQRISKIYFKASSCLELPSGTIELTSTQEGDLLSFKMSNLDQ